MDKEAIKVPVNAHCQNSIPGKGIMLKLLNLKNSWGLYRPIWTLISGYNIGKFSKFLSTSNHLTCITHPVNLITFAPTKINNGQIIM